MNRRSAALTVAVGCLVILFAVAFLAPMPYVVMSPGVTENTLGEIKGQPVVSISGHKTFPTSGNLNLTTVSVTSADYHVRLPQVLAAWWSDDQIVLPRDVIYPPDQSVQQVEHENKQQMLDSQSAAVVAGLAQDGIRANNIDVTEVVPGTPAAGVLEAGDEITSVDGQEMWSSDMVVSAVSALPPGTVVRMGVDRSGQPTTVMLRTRANPDDPSSSQIGVKLQDDYDPPFNVNINLGQEIGGPSAGLMFSLAIYDKLTPGPLTGGRFVAGTGSIDASGDVGEIGGIQQKIAGAYDAGARYFLVPAGNCAEAADSSLAGKVDLIKVETLDDAVRALHALDSGNTAAIEACG